MSAVCLPRAFCLVLLVVGGLAAGCGEEPRSVPFVNATIDAFEDGNQQSELGNTWEVIAEGTGTSAELYFPEGGFGDSQRYLALEGRRPADATGSQVVGVRVSLEELSPPADPNREPIAADAGAYTGLAFAMRGTPGTYIVQIGSALVTDFDYYNSYVEVGEEWQMYEIPFSAFSQEGFGTTVPWDSRYLTHVAFYANLSGPFQFAIDSVHFY